MTMFGLNEELHECDKANSIHWCGYKLRKDGHVTRVVLEREISVKGGKENLRGLGKADGSA